MPKLRMNTSWRCATNAVTRGTCTDVRAFRSRTHQARKPSPARDVARKPRRAGHRALHADDVQLLKFHGAYQQDDRDVREARRLARLEPDYSFFLRLRLPGGVMSPAQWLAMDAMAQRYGARGLRLTTRQTIQVHGIRKVDLRAAAQAIHACGLDTIAACGDD